MNTKRLITSPVVFLFFLLVSANVFAYQKSDDNSSLIVPSYAVADLYLHVNYETDTVSGETAASDTVDITLKDGVNVVKATGSTTAEGDGTFIIDCGEWIGGECPDIVTGDKVSGISGTGYSAMVEVGEISIFNYFRDSVDSDIVDGYLQASWLSGLIDVQCLISNESDTSTIGTTADMDGSETYSCDFSSLQDLSYGDAVEVTYFDGNHSVSNNFGWPWMRVDYTNDWVGGNYEAGHTFWITVTESDGETTKGEATVISETDGGWGDANGFTTSSGDWSPERPDIQPGDYVYIMSDDGVYNYDLEEDPRTGTFIRVGEIIGLLDVAADNVTGSLSVAWLSGELEVECHPWGAWSEGINPAVADIKYSTADANGSTPHFDCDWSSSGYDVQLGQDIAVMYIEPNLDRIIEVYMEPYRIFLPIVQRNN